MSIKWILSMTVVMMITLTANPVECQLPFLREQLCEVCYKVMQSDKSGDRARQCEKITAENGCQLKPTGAAKRDPKKP